MAWTHLLAGGGGGLGRRLWLAGRLRARAHVLGPVPLLTRVVAVAGVPAAVEDRLLPAAGTLPNNTQYNTSLTRRHDRSSESQSLINHDN